MPKKREPTPEEMEELSRLRDKLEKEKKLLPHQPKHRKGDSDKK
jgi:hypothetical protein